MKAKDELLVFLRQNTPLTVRGYNMTKKINQQTGTNNSTILQSCGRNPTHFRKMELLAGCAILEKEAHENLAFIQELRMRIEMRIEKRA